MDTNVTTFTNIFNENELKMIEDDNLVQSYKIDAENNKKKFIKFTIPIGEDIKNKLAIYKIAVGNELPMMWINGDIHKHVDTADSSFDYTNLIYITDDKHGKLVIDGKSFPIKKGNGYRFNQGLEHETVDTDPEKMRLIIGPISEKGFTVGAAPDIFYMLYTPPDHSQPYYTPPSNTTFMNITQIPSQYIPNPQSVLTGWYIDQLFDFGTAIYKVGDIVPPDTPYSMDAVYYVYPIWNTPQQPPIQMNRRPTYSNNSMVFYKSHSLASGGTAGVKNARVKSRRT